MNQSNINQRNQHPPQHNQNQQASNSIQLQHALHDSDATLLIESTPELDIADSNIYHIEISNHQQNLLDDTAIPFTSTLINSGDGTHTIHRVRSFHSVDSSTNLHITTAEFEESTSPESNNPRIHNDTVMKKQNVPYHSTRSSESLTTLTSITPVRKFQLLVHSKHKNDILSTQSQITEQFPLEIWLNILIHSKDPTPLSILNRAIYTSCKSPVIRSRFLVARYGAHRAVEGALGWRFFAGRTSARWRMGWSRWGLVGGPNGVGGRDRDRLGRSIAWSETLSAEEEEAGLIAAARRENNHNHMGNNIHPTDNENGMVPTAISSTTKGDILLESMSSCLVCKKIYEDKGKGGRKCRPEWMFCCGQTSYFRRMIRWLKNRRRNESGFEARNSNQNDEDGDEHEHDDIDEDIAELNHHLNSPNRYNVHNGRQEMTTASIRPGTSTSRYSRSKRQKFKPISSPCSLEQCQIDLIKRLLDLGSVLEPNLGNEHMIRYAAIVGHLNLLTLLIDWSNNKEFNRGISEITTVIPLNQQQPENTELKKWMINGKLLEEAVRRNNLRLIKHLSELGAAKPECKGEKAFEIAVKRRNVAALDILLEHGGKAPAGVDGDQLLINHLKKALGRRMFGFSIRRNGRSERIIEALIRGHQSSTVDFRAMADEFLVSSITELGSVRLLKVVRERGADLDMQNSVTLFFAVVIGHWRIVRYLLYEVGNIRARLFFRPRRLVALCLVLIMHVVILGWFAYNLYGFIVAIQCWNNALSQNPRRTDAVLLDEWCSSQTGVSVIDGDYWSRYSAIMLILLLTVILSQKTMPLHGILLSLCIVGVWMITRNARARRVATI